MTAVSPSSPMSVMSAIEPAIGHTRRMLFRPFRAVTWLALGFIIFLDCLGRPGANLSLNWANPLSNADAGGATRALRDVGARVSGQFAVIVLLFVLVVLVGLAFMVLIQWLSSRGHMMLIRAVALNDARIGDNWAAVRGPAWSLFVFRLAYRVCFYAIALLVGIGAFFVVLGVARMGHPGWQDYFFAILPHLALLVLLGLCDAVLAGMLHNFVTPLMMRFDMTCLEAWRHFLHLLPANLLSVAGLLLLRVAIGLVLSLLALLVCAVTCCIGLLPVIHHAILSPVYLFDRSLSLLVVGSLGPEYAIIQAPPEPEDLREMASPPPPPLG